MRLTELHNAVNPLHWFREVLGYLRDKREKRRLEHENLVLDTLIKMVDNAKTEKDRQTIIKFAKDNNIPLPRK